MTAVLGLGNLVHTDDRVGVHAIQQLQRDPRVPSATVLLDGGTQGLSLISHISGFSRLLVIDAVNAGEPPGTLLRFEGSALRGLPGKASVLGRVAAGTRSHGRAAFVDGMEHGTDASGSRCTPRSA